jgi:DNA-binding response OmpR family regulator
MAVAVVVNDAGYREVLVRGLGGRGLDAEGFDCAGTLYQRLLARSFDALVLDLGLTDEHGLDVARYLREVRRMRIVVLHGDGAPAEEGGGAPDGVDAWLPAAAAVEIVAAAVGRLAEPAGPEAAAPPDEAEPAAWTLSSGAWQLVAPDGRSVFLSAVERCLLVRLFEARNAPVPCDELVSLLSGFDAGFDRDRLTNAVGHLRRKVRQQLGHAPPLLGRRGRGYCFGVVPKART